MKIPHLATMSVKTRIWLVIWLAIVFMIGRELMVLNTLDKEIMASRKAKIQQLVDVAHSTLNHYYELEKKGTLSREDAQKAAMATVKILRYQEKDYFWINDMHPKMIMHPFKPELDGKDISGFKDPDGKHLFVAMVEEVRRQGQGFVDYRWPKPGLDHPVPKLSFVKGFEPWGWIIGTGLYMDDLKTLFWAEAKRILAIFIASIILLIALAYLLARSIIQPLNQVSEHIREVAAGNLTKRVDFDGGKDEISQIGEQVNLLAASLSRTVRTIVLQSQTVNACVGHMQDVRQSLEEDAEKSYIINRDLAAENAKLGQGLAELKDSVAKASDNMDTITLDGKKLSSEIHAMANSARQASQNVTTMARSAEEMSSHVAEVNNNLEHVLDSVNTVAAAIEEMNVNLGGIRHQCDTAEKESKTANHHLHESQQVMERLIKSAQEINMVVGAINGIAAQIKMLALNAAIEAAGAGEAGKGFSVVANEVKDLALKAAEATSMISANIEKIQTNTKDAANAMDEVVTVMKRIDKVNEEITLAVQEQNQTTTEISRSTSGVATAAQSVSETAKSLQMAVQEVAHAASLAAKATDGIASASSSAAHAASDVADKSSQAKEFIVSLLAFAEKTEETTGSNKMLDAFELGKFLRNSVNYYSLLTQAVSDASSYLSQAQQGLHIGNEPYDVRTLKHEFLNWISKTGQIANDRLCQQGDDREHNIAMEQWLASTGRRLFGNHQLLSEIVSLNQKASRMAHEIFQKADQGHVEEVNHLLNEFGPLRSTLFAKLDQLYLMDETSLVMQK
ncbi:MAG: methyl-accepting chemotaxis protein [Magnetococcales bacterium]|nr:methyl-accepting chemotaxis protein [Magnetococcales bacterium]